MKSFLLVPMALLGLMMVFLPAWANASSPLGYKTVSVGHFHKTEWLIPQVLSSDRIYIRTKLRQSVTQAQMLIDDHTLVHPLGNTQNTSIPAVLSSGYQRQYSDIQVFPLMSVKHAQTRIQLGWTLDNGKRKQLIIHGKQLQRLLKAFP